MPGLNPESPNLLPRQPEQKEGWKPLRVAIVDREYVETHFPEKVDFEDGGVYVEYAGKNQELHPKGIETIGMQSMESANPGYYKDRGFSVISAVDEKDKFSKEFGGCTGLVVRGLSHEGKAISFMSHQNPQTLLGDSPAVAAEAEKLKELLGKALEEIKEKSVEGTLDVLIIGGGYDNTVKLWSQYSASIITLGNLVEEKLGKRPEVCMGPNLKLGKRSPGSGTFNNDTKWSLTDAYLDTKEGRLYVIRPQQDDSKLNEFFEAPRDSAGFKELNDKWHSL